MMIGIKAKDLLVSLVVSIILIWKAESIEIQALQNPVVDNLEYGCIFEDKDFKTQTTDPNWSTLNSVEDLHLCDLAMNIDWILLKNKITTAFRSVNRNYPLNNVDQFIRFIQAYKNQTGDKLSLESFFNNYHVPFQPLEDPVSFLMEIRRELINNYSGKIKNKMYIVSAYVDPPESYVRDVKKAHTNINLTESMTVVEELTKERFQRHVAGIIKITYGKTKERGIILLDPGYINGDKRVNPYFALLMENATSEEHNEHLYGDGHGGIDFTMGPMFVLASGKLTQQDKKRNVLYYRYKPFCSFMESTTKGNLLAPNHGIMTFEPIGSPKGYLTFDVVPKIISKKSPFFKIATFKKYKETETYLGRIVTFDSIRTANTSISSKNAIENVAKNFNLKEGDNLLSKLQTIQSEVFEYPDLVTEIYELTNKLNPKNHSILDKIGNIFAPCGF